jgi:hypothetical protein
MFPILIQHLERLLVVLKNYFHLLTPVENYIVLLRQKDDLHIDLCSTGRS